MNKFISLAVALLAATLAAPTSWAQQARQEAVEARLSALKIVRQTNGKETTASADSAKPGDVLEYRVTYSNRSREAVRNLVGTLPIPVGMEYLPKSAQPASITVSLDGVKYQATPVKRKVKSPDGKSIEQEVSPLEYRSLRWMLGDLAPGKSVTVSARVQLTPVEGPVPVQASATGTGSKSQ